ncbi:MAG: MBL fold metallo-hydrolase [Oscillospiraceae bacterium]|nr:MBL fold metallo-hydrolase [Oscillospiraceae bacterium]
MKLITLVENTACCESLASVHGLSQYVETATHKLLVDAGPNRAFLENAEKLGVDLTAVDTVILSHGHYDHTGGLAAFFVVNKTAKVYVRKEAFDKYFSCVGDMAKYIGMEESLLENRERFVFTEELTVMDEELTLFAEPHTHDHLSKASSTLRRFDGENYLPDDFCHEQNLLITDGGKTTLLCGCAHRGIVNILRRAEEILGKAPDYVFGGFHLFNPTTGAPESEELIAAVANELKARENTLYFTGHCTGTASYELLRRHMGEQISYMAGGSSFTL